MAEWMKSVIIGMLRHWLGCLAGRLENLLAFSWTRDATLPFSLIDCLVVLVNQIRTVMRNVRLGCWRRLVELVGLVV